MDDSFVSFFGLRENPFSSKSDPRYLCLTRPLEDCLAELVLAIQKGKGLLVTTGEAGTGKTTLIRQLFDWLTEHQVPAGIFPRPEFGQCQLGQLHAIRVSSFLRTWSGS